MSQSITPDQIENADLRGIDRVLAVREGAQDGTGVLIWAARLMAPLCLPSQEGAVVPRGDLLIAVSNPDDDAVRADLEARVYARRAALGLLPRVG